MKPFILTPRDGMTIKDARGFNVAGGTAARSLSWPLPSTLAGALRTAVGRKFLYNEREDPRWEALRQTAVKGPLAVRRAFGAEWQPLFPSPMDALFVASDNQTTNVSWLRPEPPDKDVIVRASWGRTDESVAIEKLWRGRPPGVGKPLASTPWWSADQFVHWLLRPGSGKAPEGIAAPARRTDIHLAIDPTSGAAKDGALFSVETIETWDKQKNEWGIWGSCELDTIPSGPWHFGGEARLAGVEVLSNDPFTVPRALDDWKESSFLRLVLMSPGVFREGWRPKWLAPSGGKLAGKWKGLHLTLRAAFVGRAQTMSGWDFVKRKPKESRRAAPAGSVYYFECDHPLKAAAIKELWLASMQDIDEGKPSHDELDGFGMVVPGAWPDATGLGG